MKKLGEVVLVVLLRDAKKIRTIMEASVFFFFSSLLNALPLLKEFSVIFWGKL